MGTQQARQEGACLRPKPRVTSPLSQPPKHEGWGGAGVHPPRRGGTWDAFNKQGACLGAKERSGESGSGHRLALLREPRSSHLALLSTSLIRRQKDKPWEGEGLSLELALLLGGS